MSTDQGASASADRAATLSEPSQSSVVSGVAGIPCAGDYGKHGGTSANAGKRSELLRSPSTGLTKRVFNGQRWLVVAQQNEDAECFLTAFEDEPTAKRVSDGCHRLGYEVHYVERAEVMSL